MLFTSSFFFLSSTVPCYAANQQYFQHPVFYSTVDEAFAAIRNMPGQFVGWQGTPPQKIDLDRFGLRVFGVLDYTTTTQELVGGLLFGNWVDVQTPHHLEETTIIPFDRLQDLLLMHYPDLDKEYKWGVVAIISGSDDPPAFRTPTRETATILFNAIASLSQASGHPIRLSRMGAYLRDVTSDDLKIEEIKALGLSKPTGMLVDTVMLESPASTGGMLKNDVIVECNGQPVTSYEQWVRDIFPTATSLTLKVLKKDRSTTRFVELTPLESLPQPPAGLVFPPPASTSTGEKPPKLGFNLRAPNELEKKALNGKQAAVISSISPGGLAEAAQLQVGDVLLECNGKPILGPEGLGGLLTAGTNAFTVMRNGKIITVKVSPEVSY